MPPPPAWQPVWLVLGSPQELRAPRTQVPREVRWWGGAAGHALWFLSFTWVPAGSDLGADEVETAQTELHVSPKYAGRFLLPLKVPSDLAKLWDYLLRFWYWRYFIF